MPESETVPSLIAELADATAEDVLPPWPSASRAASPSPRRSASRTRS